MITFFKNIKLVAKLVFNKDEQLMISVKEFVHANKNLLIIIADKKTDRIFVAYNDKIVNGTIKSLEGKNSHVVRDVLRFSRFNQNIGQFVAALVETLHIPLTEKNINEFFKFIDGALYNIARATRKVKKFNGVDKPVEKVENSPVVSPYTQAFDEKAEK